MLQSLPTYRRRDASGFSLIELIVTVAIIGFLAATATAVYMNQKNKAIESEIPTRVGETAMALELYKQRNLGSLANSSNPLTAEWLQANGVTGSSNIATRVCVNWSNGGETPGEYTIYSYYVDASTGEKVDSSKMYVLDSGANQSTAEVATSQQETQICDEPLEASVPPGVVFADTSEPPGTREVAFNTAMQGGPSPGTVRTIVPRSDQGSFVAGNFTSWNGSIGGIARLNPDGSLNATFRQNIGQGADAGIRHMSATADGGIIVVGQFQYFGDWGGDPVGCIAKLNADGVLDTAFHNNTGSGAEESDSVYATAVQSNGQILVGGSIRSWDGDGAVDRILRLNSDGTRDTTFTTNLGSGPNALIRTIVVQPDQTILVGGDFTSWNNDPVGGIVRLNSDGTRQTSFTTTTGSGAGGPIYTIAVQANGGILVGGDFSTWSGSPVGRLVRLTNTGARDTTFSTNVGTGSPGIVYSIAPEPSNSAIVGIASSSWNGTTAMGRILRLNSDGTRDAEFSAGVGTGASQAVYSVARQTNGDILVGGAFTAWQGDTSVIRITRLAG